MEFSIIDEQGKYALVLRGKHMAEYAVVYGLNHSSGNWEHTCSYYYFGPYANISKAEALFHAVDSFRMRTDPKYIPYARMCEIATVLKDGLIEDGEEEAYEYMADVVELSEVEAGYLGLDMEKYRNCEEKEADDQ